MRKPILRIYSFQVTGGAAKGYQILALEYIGRAYKVQEWVSVNHVKC